jgi:hypothetical protein
MHAIHIFMKNKFNKYYAIGYEYNIKLKTKIKNLISIAKVFGT